MRGSAIGAVVSLALVAAACGGGSSATPGPQCGTPGPGWIAFIDRVTGPFTIAVAKEDGTCRTTVAADAGGALSPSWSAAAHALAYSGSDAGETAIRVHDLVTGVTSTVPVSPIVPGSVALSPDGARLAFDGRVGTGASNVYTVPVAGGDPVAIGSSAASDTSPAWSADGATVYFVSDRRAGVPDVWAAPGDGSLDPVEVTTGSGILGRPALAPDGLRLAYARKKLDGTSQLVERVLATGVERVVSDLNDGEPAYDATGTLLGASTYRYSISTPDVVILDAATGALVHRVTDGAGASGAPAFPR